MRYTNEPIDKKEMGERIRISRDRMHMSREQLADMVEISPAHLADLETGNKGMSVQVLYQIGKELSTGTDYLLEGCADYKDIDGSRQDVCDRMSAMMRKCSVRQLECLEEIVRSYIKAIEQADE